MDWEAGARPNWDYQDLLSRLFHSSPVQLGWVTDYTPAGSAASRGSLAFAPAGAFAGTQAKKVAAQAEIRTAVGRRRMSRDEIATVVAALGELAQVVQGADPADKADIYAKLRLTLTYQPQEKEVQAIVTLGLNMPKGVVSEGGLEPPQPSPATSTSS